MQKTLIAITASLLTVATASAYKPEVGDIVFHTSTSSQSAAVQAATHSPYSHMGVVLLRNGSPMVLEAVQPVKYTELKVWLNRGKGQNYVIKRLNFPLSASASSRMNLEAAKYIGKPYDLTFEWSNEKIYCSELVWKLYKEAADIELAPLATLGSFDLKAPAVKAKLKERYGSNIPTNEPVIAPSAIFESSLLTTVDKR
jgi:uncharacterized protein YycO